MPVVHCSSSLSLRVPVTWCRSDNPERHLSLKNAVHGIPGRTPCPTEPTPHPRGFPRAIIQDADLVLSAVEKIREPQSILIGDRLASACCLISRQRSVGLEILIVVDVAPELLAAPAVHVGNKDESAIFTQEIRNQHIADREDPAGDTVMASAVEVDAAFEPRAISAAFSLLIPSHHAFLSRHGTIPERF